MEPTRSSLLCPSPFSLRAQVFAGMVHVPSYVLHSPRLWTCMECHCNFPNCAVQTWDPSVFLVANGSRVLSAKRLPLTKCVVLVSTVMKTQLLHIRVNFFIFGQICSSCRYQCPVAVVVLGCWLFLTAREKSQSCNFLCAAALPEQRTV